MGAVNEAGEKDPHDINQHAPGAKLDAGKVMAGVLADFPRALLAVAEVGTFGANKYTRGGWQSVSDGVTRYTDAMWRHLLAESIDPTDADSGLPHAAQIAWNALARLELMIRQNEGYIGIVSDFVAAKTIKSEALAPEALAQSYTYICSASYDPKQGMVYSSKQSENL